MKQYVLGIELGSTRIKAVLIDETHAIVKSGGDTWKSSLENGVWTYHMDEVQAGLRTALRNLGELPGEISAMGVSAMMHGYLAFDKDWNLLAPFRTWQNTMTGEAADRLTEAFGFNIPQRWSVAHLYQAILNGEAHVRSIAHITTLAGYVHYLLTGENAVGIGEASGMFPIDSRTGGRNSDRGRKRVLGSPPARRHSALPAGGRRGHRHDGDQRRRAENRQRLRRHVHLRYGRSGKASLKGLSRDRHGHDAERQARRHGPLQ